MTCKPAPVADELPAGADHPVAWHDDGERVPPVGEADRPDGSRTADGLRDVPVRAGLSVRDFQQGLPHRLLERRALRVQVQVEVRPLPLEVLAELAFDRAKRRGRLLPFGLWSERALPALEGDVPEAVIVAPGEHELADGRVDVGVVGGVLGVGRHLVHPVCARRGGSVSKGMRDGHGRASPIRSLARSSARPTR